MPYTNAQLVILAYNFLAYFLVGFVAGYAYIFFYASLPGVLLRRFLRSLFPVRRKNQYIRLVDVAELGSGH